MNMVTACIGLCYKVDVVFADNAAWLLVISKKIKNSLPQSREFFEKGV